MLNGWAQTGSWRGHKGNYAGRSDAIAAAIIGSSAIYERTGSYDFAIITIAVGLFLVTPLGLRAQRASQ
ncbi:MAG: hypothetical protein ABI673_06680 [Novosphingobium sp.]